MRSCLVVDDCENPGRVLYGVSPTDAVSFSAALALVMTVVLVASLIPAWRASRTDPVTALRHR
ncbi:MAG TPA: hypothetical protein VKA59_02060 [Vicinamibacterales bacterium]|nr:hypothetical protein [Vicinamibacterales bacterium]